MIHKHFRRENVIKIEDVELLTDRKTVRICNEDFQLRRKEYMILELLMQNPDKTFSAEEIYEYIWKEDFLDNDRVVAVQISNIRKKTKKYRLIDTVWGVGFKFHLKSKYMKI